MNKVDNFGKNISNAISGPLYRLVVAFPGVVFVVLGFAANAMLTPARGQPAPSGPGIQVTVPPDDNAEPPEVAAANDSASALAEKLQNPVGNLNSIPLQNNTNFNVGPQKGTQDILNIQPVIPFRLTPDWNIITRTIFPLVWNPSLQPAQSIPFGLGPATFSAFLSPAKPINGFVWGAGPVVQLPTITSKTLGSNVWVQAPPSSRSS